MSIVRSPRFPLILMAAACLVFGGVYAALWSAGASAMRKTVAALAETDDPLAVDIGSIRTKGFPFFLRGQLRDVSVRNGPAAWRAPSVLIDAVPISPNRFVFTAADPQAVDLGRWGAYEVSTDGARASVTHKKGGFVADAQADSVAAKPTRGDAALRANGVLFKAAPDAVAPNAVHASLFAGLFEIERGARTAKGEKLLLDLVATRRNGVEGFDINRLTLEARGGSVELKGRVVIDADGYPAGVIDSVVKNPKGLAAFLADLGAIEDDEAQTAGAALSLAALATGGEIRAPIELKNGAAQIAGIKIAKLPKLR